MVDCYIGEIRMFVGTHEPSGWAFCQGQKLQIAQYEPLYSLLGTQFGGDGVSTFALPDLRGRLAIGSGTGANPTLTERKLAQTGGAETVTVQPAEMPKHTHQISATSAAATAITAGPSVTFGAVGKDQVFYNDTNNPSTGTGLFSPLAISTTGGSQPHGNTMPTTVLNYIIALNGIYPEIIQ